MKTDIPAYDPDVLQARVLPKIGERINGTVSAIETGKIADLIGHEALQEWRNIKADDPAIRVAVKLSDGTTMRKTMTMPPENQVHPKSNMAKWKKIYGGYPRVGQEVFLIANEEGYYEFVL